MPPFQYASSFDARPWSGSIAEMIQRQGEIPAEAALRAGQARARGTEQAGMLRGRAWEQTGQDINRGALTIGADLAQAPRREMEKLQLEAEKQGLLDDQILRKALSLSASGDLRPGLAFVDAQGPAGVVAKQKLLGLVRQREEQHNEDAGQLGWEILQGGGTPDAVGASVRSAIARGVLTPAEGQALHMAAVEQPEAIPDRAKQLMAKSPKFQAVLQKENEPYTLGENQRRFVGTQQIAEGPPKTPPQPTTASLALAAAGNDPAAALTALQAPQVAAQALTAAQQKEVARHNQELERIAGLTAGRAEAAQRENERHHRAMENKPAGTATVVIQTPDGPQVVNKGTGTASPITSGGVVVPPMPTGAQRGQVSENEAALAGLTRIKELAPTAAALDKWIGPLLGPANKIKMATPGVAVDPQMAEFYAEVAALKNRTIKAITGAQMSEPEAKRILEQVPDVNLKPDVFLSRWAATERNLKTINDVILKKSPSAATPAPGGGVKVGKYTVTVNP